MKQPQELISSTILLTVALLPGLEILTLIQCLRAVLLIIYYTTWTPAGRRGGSARWIIAHIIPVLATTEMPISKPAVAIRLSMIPVLTSSWSQTRCREPHWPHPITLTRLEI